MPLIKSKSKKAFGKNVEKEMDAGRPQKQALAIAYATQRRAKGKKMAHGGSAESRQKEKESIKGIHKGDFMSLGTSPAGRYAHPGRTRKDEWAKKEHDRVLNEARSMKKPNLYAEGGPVCPPDCPACHSQSMVERIRHQKMMADGGMVDKDAGYEFDIHDEIEHPNYYDDLNADIANEKLYEDTYGPDPEDSNEKGDKLEDADRHGKSTFKKIKMKRAQPGDRGKY